MTRIPAKRPPTLADAAARGLLAEQKDGDISTAHNGICTFSNGSDWDYWADRNCFDCMFFDLEGDAGEFCAFEAASFLGSVSPALAVLFGWTQEAEYDKPDDHRQGWQKPETCAFFANREQDDDGNDMPPPPPVDPNQLVLIADPTEDLAAFPTSVPQRELVEVSA